LTGTNLLYHFPFLFEIISRVRSGATQPTGIVDASVFRSLMMEDAVLPQAVHFGLASFAVVGIALFGHALQAARLVVEDNPTAPDAAEPAEAATDAGQATDLVSDLAPDARRIAAWGARLALAATLCQIPTGLWLVMKLAPDAQQRVLGSDPLATGLLGVSILLTLGLLHHLAALAFGSPRRNSMILAMGLTAAIVTLMTAVLQRI